MIADGHKLIIDLLRQIEKIKNNFKNLDYHGKETFLQEIPKELKIIFKEK